MFKTKLKRACQAYDLKYVSLRYFNACGADAAGDIGEDHADESHLIPLILQVQMKRRKKKTHPLSSPTWSNHQEFFNANPFM